ncbi:uncharacterized protein LOC128735493 [Sabethes cyaneus]|uniref:uncharacterized protein LOC128735493 n=1 Tax=Sabethes cyaneus TaxID=53552 RepID=UPI00237D416B|nr:uncharacterized protein LOC128735493 [Sabethes cyaneus]
MSHLVNIQHPCHRPSHHFSPPGRSLDCTLEAPGSSSPVVPSPASIQQSRPGPVARCGSGVFQLAPSCKYSHDIVHSLPDVDPIHSTVDYVNFRENGPVAPSFDKRIAQPADDGENPVCFSIENGQHPPNVFVRETDCSTPSRKEDIIVFYQNAGGMNSHVEEYRLAVSDRCYDVIALCETWLDSRTVSSQVFGSDYEVFRCDRNPNNSRKAIGGGVLIAVRRGLEARAIENNAWNCVEQIWTAIKLSDRTLFLCALYIAPDRVRDNDLIDVHCQSVYSIMRGATPLDEIIILGDFNLPGISWKPVHSGFLFPDPENSTIHAAAVNLLDNYSAAMLHQVNHVVNENNRCLDLCFVSSLEKPPFITAAPCPLIKPVLHHPPLIVCIEDKPLRDFIEFPAAISYNFRKADMHSINGVLSSIDWAEILDPEDVEAAAQTFSHVLLYVIDRHVPKRSHRNTSHPSWYTNELRKLKSFKRAALRRFTKHRTLSLKRHYARVSHLYRRASRQCFSRHQQSIQRKLKRHPKCFWNYVNDQRRESGLPSSMEYNGEIAAAPQDICRSFSSKFASVFTNEVLSVDHVALAACNVPIYGQTLGAIDVNVEKISKAASMLKSSFNPGPDGVPSAFLKRHISCLLTPLLYLFRMSISSGVFPSCWKFAHMFPVHKKGSKRDVNNYRGITSLSAVSKLFELVIMEPLLSHCKQYLSADQHGFISQRSTTTNLLCLTSYITGSMDHRAQTDVLYTDLSAAFDKINHDIAIAKLHRLGVSDNLLRWFRSYLTNRQLVVAIGDCNMNVK